MLQFQEKYSQWCQDPAFDLLTREETQKLTDEKEIEDRFYKDLEFGTAGLRGIMGAGTNRMNRYTVGKATLGLARYLLEVFPEAKTKGVVIGYDTRNRSAEFSRNTADVLTAMGIPVRLFDQPVPTPVLSFAIRHFGCVSGVVITASHNPPQYNGYKAYTETGCQLGVKEAECVTKYISEITDWGSIPFQGNDSLLTMIGDETLDVFTDTVLKESSFEDKKAKEDLSLVYTPIHGSGYKPVCQVLEKDGFKNVHIVEEQKAPDGNFPTVKSPNPEERGALALGIALAQEIGADLVIGTDPDSDRIGCAALENGTMKLLSGNQIGSLLVDFVMKNKAKPGTVPVVINTIVTSDMGEEIAKKRGGMTEKVLTGFRFIGETMDRIQEEKSERRFILGYEESYGYLSGDHARDKDAVCGALLIAEMAAFYKKEGKTLWQALDALYQEFGCFIDVQDSFTLQGKEGLERIIAIMSELREDPSFLTNLREVQDYKDGKFGLPPANVLKYVMDDFSWIAARPSGTEPKIKFYYCIRGKDQASAEASLAFYRKAIGEKTGLMK